MKKRVLLVLLLILALVLCACDKQAETPIDPSTNDPVVQTPEQNPPVDPAPNTPESSNTESEAADSITQGYPFIYQGEITWSDCEPDLSNCIMDALYYVDSVTGEVHLICEDPVTGLSHNCAKVYGSTNIYFVTAAEPNKIYATTPKAHTQHTLVYESDSGPITFIHAAPAPFSLSALQLIVDNKQFVWLDLNTGEASVVMEQYYLRYAYFSDDNPNAKSWQDFEVINFTGKFSEEEYVSNYDYWIKEDKIVELEVG